MALDGVTNAAVGRARALVSCSGAGRATRFLNVVRATPVPAAVRVEKMGFSQRNRAGSARVSYGVVLVNPAPDKDANEVIVQVNIVDASNTVLASPVTRVRTIGAGATYFLGGSTILPVGGTAVRLEPIVRVGAKVERRLHVPPVADVRFYAARFDPEWMGVVAGQVLNDLRGIGLARASLSVVVFDATGAVVGGTTGTTSGSVLPPGGRAFWQAQSGLDSIPWSRVAAVQVSVNPTWEPLD